MPFPDEPEPCGSWLKAGSIDRCWCAVLRISIVARVLEKCGDDSCWISFFPNRLLKCSNVWTVSNFHLLACCHHAYRRPYTDLSQPLKEISPTTKGSPAGHKPGCRRRSSFMIISYVKFMKNSRNWNFEIREKKNFVIRSFDFSESNLKSSDVKTASSLIRLDLV